MDKSTVTEFASKVSRYFLEFLESDFHRQRAPRRRVQLRTDSGLLAAMALRRYPTLAQAVRQLIACAVKDGLELKIPHRKFLSPLSPTLRNLIEQHIASLPDSSFENVRRHVLHTAKSTRGQAVDHPEVWVERVIEVFAESFSVEVVRPLLTLLDGPIREQAYSPVDSAFALEADMVSLLTEPAAGALPPALNTYLVTGNLQPATAVLDDLVSSVEGKRKMVAFFSDFGTADAYAELRDIVTYLHTGENLHFYLYFCNLSFGNQTYPLFYLPGTVSAEPNRAEYLITFEPHLYVNKAAVDFVRQEKRSPSRATGDSPVRERIIYLTEDDTVLGAVARDIPGLCAALDLPSDLDVESATPQKVRTTEVSMDNAFMFAAFDQSDQALCNDYEELLKAIKGQDSEVTLLFEDIIRGIIMEEPVSVRQDVEKSVDDQPLAARLVIESPIPLNDEQQAIRKALQDPHCRFVVVQGPPGTGKSHTISALAFDSILRNQSALILSDKTEALDVVEDKLGKTMSAVRGDEDFQNPILRLGKSGANYKRLVSGASLTQIQAHHRAQIANTPHLDNELRAVTGGLAADIQKTAATLSSLKMRFLMDHVELENRLRQKHGGAFVETLQRIAEDPHHSERLSKFASFISANLLDRALGLPDVDPKASIMALHRTLYYAFMAASNICENAPRAGLALLKPVTEEAVKTCLEHYWRFTKLRRPVIGYLFRRPAVEAIERDLYVTGHLVAPINLRSHGEQLYAALTFLLSTAEKLSQMEKMHLSKADLPFIHTWLLRTYNSTDLDKLCAWLIVWHNQIAALPALGNPGGREIREIIEDSLVAAHYAREHTEIAAIFRGLPEIDYLGRKSLIEQLCTSKMTSIVDGRFLDFADNQKAKMRSLAGVISQRAKFPTDHFEALRSAFPVILASIREFAEYMPLSRNLFDLVIIDEGSQVSVAQALPAILRARKVVVFGDNRQFSNVKSANASNERNNAFRTDLKAFFTAKVAKDAARLQRLAMFDVKASVLEFFELCANYSTMLRKHFRGPAELISFSSEKFYSGQLQAIKVRTQPIEDVLRFDVVPPREGGEPMRNVNQAEAAFIIGKLEAMLKDEDPPTVGIITPFREQQQYITRALIHHQRWGDFESKLHIKVMTFDTCQGEEREVVLYSLVATRERDVLNYVFPADLDGAAENIEEKLKIQRLNVGFSRGQETLWFVLSKPLDEYHGSIGVALRHYREVLTKRAHGEIEETDQRSPMEPKVLGWLKAAEFLQQQASHVDIQPQFPIGRYLRQLDPSYRHPLWKVDFLVTFARGDEVVQVIVEYDGFETHFAGAEGVDAANYGTYMTEKDLERQLVIESYGYKFLRLNRFNLGRNPATVLSERLKAIVEGASRRPASITTTRVIETRKSLVNGDSKQCKTCGEIKPLQEFFDQALQDGVGGYGRKCSWCKRRERRAPTYQRRRRRHW